jgi:hypothetical protein
MKCRLVKVSHVELKGMFVSAYWVGLNSIFMAICKLGFIIDHNS